MESNKRSLRVISYSEYPGPRYCNQGECSGEDFYHRKLNNEFAEAFSAKQTLVVDLDGTAGYASSFLDEAFGNLIYDFTKDVVINNITLISKQEPDWKEMIFSEVFADWETRRVEKKVPRKTERHEEWYRFENGKLIKRKWL
jgi:hypothetical protein